jgi:hypothetical protein
MEPAKFLEEGLRSIILPPLIRPPVPPEADPTEELIFWGMRKYAYSLIAHIRTVLKGIVLLAEAGNAPAFIIICRHIYEWNMQCSYAYVTFRSFLKEGNLKGAWELYLTVCEGNGWMKRHGEKYVPEMPYDEIEDPIHLREFKNEYKKYRIQALGSENVDDDYGYLSERSHPNGFCFQPYISLNPPEVRFVDPAPRHRLPGTLDACVLEWAMTMTRVLGLAREDNVRCQLTELLQKLTEKAAESNDGRIPAPRRVAGGPGLTGRK